MSFDFQFCLFSVNPPDEYFQVKRQSNNTERFLEFRALEAQASYANSREIIQQGLSNQFLAFNSQKIQQNTYSAFL